MDNLTGVIPQSWRRAKKGRSRLSYERLNRRQGKGRSVKIERLGKKSWHFKMPKIRIKIVSPFTLLGRLRDAYVRMMMNIAGRAQSPGLAYGLGPTYMKPAPSRNREVFSDAELLCLEYLKRDTNFLIQAARIHAEAQPQARSTQGQ